MAICKLNTNLTRANQCGYSLPEIVELYLVNYEDLTDTALAPEVETEDGCREISGITLASGATVAKVEPLRTVLLSKILLLLRTVVTNTAMLQLLSM